MSMSDDPRGFRRGPAGARDYAPQQGQGGRSAPQAGDRYPQQGYRQQEPAPSQARPERRPPPEKNQPAFSAYRPEAYAANERPAPNRAERPAWESDNRNAPPPPPQGGMAPTSEPFPRTPQARDPYYQGGSSDPYAPPSQRSYGNDWQRDPYPDQDPHYYPPLDGGANGAGAEEVHDHFFAPERDADIPPPPAPLKGRLRAFDEHDYERDPGYGAQQPNGFNAQPPRDYEPAQRHHGVHGGFEPSGFDGGRDIGWDNYEQTPAPAPAAVRPFHPPAPIHQDEDLDADFFSDEDDYDAEEYRSERKGGRKKLVAAVLTCAIVTGGGLAYVYKSNSHKSGEAPSLITADSRPVKEQPADPGGRDFPNGNKLIYDRLGGGGEESKPTKLASGDGAQRAAANMPGIITTGGTLEERIESALKARKDDEPAKAAASDNRSPDAPRTVRTMTFGPDGTQKPTESSTKRITVGSAPSENISSGVVVTSEAAETPSSATVSNQSIAQAQPVQRARPAEERPVTRLAAATPQQVPVTDTAVGGAGQFFVQIAARNDEQAANAAFKILQQKYGSVLGNYSPSVQKADLGDKGVWYRLLIGPIENKGDADQLCEKLKSAGMKSCFARKG